VKRILLIDDDPSLLASLLRRFRAHRVEWDLATAGNGLEAMRLAREEPFDVVVTDILMPVKEGLETIQELREEFPTTRIIAMSGGSRRVGIDVLKIARMLGAEHVLPKPFLPEDLIALTRAMLEEPRGAAPSSRGDRHRP
jgi:DNA-binding response OmpR family regulator